VLCGSHGCVFDAKNKYVTKVCEMVNNIFVQKNASGDPVINIEGLIIAGSADLKNELINSGLLNYQLKPKILKVLDIAYGDVQGLNDAINQSVDILKNVKFVQEKIITGLFFEMVSSDSNLYVHGADSTLNALSSGAVETLIVSENLQYIRYTMKHKITQDVKTIISQKKFVDDPEWIATSSVLLTEWLADHYNEFGSKLELVSSQSEEGFQFQNGFGIGGILRYPFEDYNKENEENLQDNDDDNSDTETNEISSTITSLQINLKNKGKEEESDDE